MRTFLVLALFTLFSFSVTAQSKKNQKAIIQTTFYCDHCKQCETCGKNFQANMYKITGLKMFEIDEKNMTITVFYNETKTNLQAIRTAIAKMGFDADDIKADPAAYENLDNCCKA